MKEQKANMEELVERHKEFVRNIVESGEEFKIPQISWAKGEEVKVTFPENRKEAKITIEEVKNRNPDWIALIFEGYFKKGKREKLLEEYERGQIKKEFEEGKERTGECVILQIQKGKEKKGVFFELNEDREIVDTTEEKKTEGFLSL